MVVFGHDWSCAVQVHLDDIDDRWSSSVMIGLVCLRDVRETLPSSALDMRSPCWVVCEDSVYKNGHKACNAAVVDYCYFINQLMVKYI